jgi:hypothetical protein
VVSLEHRYYGASTPFDNIATENLKYLSSSIIRQAFSFLFTVIVDGNLVEVMWVKVNTNLRNLVENKKEKDICNLVLIVNCFYCNS